MTPDQLRIRKLEEEIEALKAEIEWLRGGDLFDDAECAVFSRLGLAPLEWRVIRLLFRRGFASRPAIMVSLYGDEDHSLNLVSLIVSKARPKLAPWGVTIRCVWGQGYQMPKESRILLQGLLDAERQGLAA